MSSLHLSTQVSLDRILDVCRFAASKNSYLSTPFRKFSRRASARARSPDYIDKGTPSENVSRLDHISHIRVHTCVYSCSFRNFVVIVQKSADACKNSRSHSSVSNVEVRAEISGICLFSCIVWRALLTSTGCTVYMCVRENYAGLTNWPQSWLRTFNMYTISLIIALMRIYGNIHPETCGKSSNGLWMLCVEPCFMISRCL